MTTRQKITFGLFLFVVIATNYEAQISHLTNDEVARWTLHDWFGAILNVLIAGAVTAKAYLTDSSAPQLPSGPH